VTEKVVYCEKRTEHVSIECALNAQLYTVIPGGSYSFY